MSDLDPEQLTPEGWETQEWFDSFERALEQGYGDKVRLVNATILHATYCHEKETIAVNVRREDNGREAVSYLPKASMRFNGKHYLDLPKEETDRQMKKTADLFLKRKGSRVKLRVFDK